MVVRILRSIIINIDDPIHYSLFAAMRSKVHQKPQWLWAKKVARVHQFSMGMFLQRKHNNEIMANTNGLLIAFKNIVTLAENPTRMAKHTSDSRGEIDYLRMITRTAWVTNVIKISRKILNQKYFLEYLWISNIFRLKVSFWKDWPSQG